MQAGLQRRQCKAPSIGEYVWGIDTVSWLNRVLKRDKTDPECRESRELPLDSLEGDLDESIAQRISSHLDKCPPCRSFVNTLRTTVDLLRGMPKRQAGEELRCGGFTRG